MVKEKKHKITKDVVKSPTKEVITGYDNILASSDIEKMILTIRGQQVMIDKDLAMIYEIETKYLKRAVKTNMERFPEDFMFELTRDEFNDLRCKFSTSSAWGGTRYMPYAFTQAGIAMLSGILRSEVAVQANIRIMRAFVSMRQYIAVNAQIFQRLDRIEIQQIENQQWKKATENKIDTILDKIEKRSPAMSSEQIFATGCVWDAWSYISELIRSAKKSIHLIDNFVDDRVLTALSKRNAGVEAVIHTRYTEQFTVDIQKHNKQYEPIRFEQLPHKNHDRFLIIDDEVYLLGASVKDMGSSLCAVTKMEANAEKILALIKE